METFFVRNPVCESIYGTIQSSFRMAIMFIFLSAGVMMVLLMNSSLPLEDMNDLNQLVLLLSFQQLVLSSLTAGFEIKSLEAYQSKSYGDILVYFIHTLFLMFPGSLICQVVLFLFLYYTPIFLSRPSSYFDSHLSIFTLSPYLYIGGFSSIYWRFILVIDSLDITILGLGMIIPSTVLLGYYFNDPGIVLSVSLSISLLSSLIILIYRRRELFMSIIEQYQSTDVFKMDIFKQNAYLSFSNVLYTTVEQSFFFFLPFLHIDDLTYSTGYYLLFNCSRILEQIYQSLATAGFVVISYRNISVDSIIGYSGLSFVFSISIISILSIFNIPISYLLTDQPDILLTHIPFFLVFLFVRINLFCLISVNFVMKDLVHILIAMTIFYSILLMFPFGNPWINLIISTILITLYLIIVILIRLGIITHIKSIVNNSELFQRYFTPAKDEET